MSEEKPDSKQEEAAVSSKEEKQEEKKEEKSATESGKDKPQDKAAGVDTSGLSKRRSLWKACVDSFVYVNNISQDEAVKVRDSDRATSIWLMIVSIVTVVAMLIEPLAPHRMPLLIVCDILIGMSIFYYIGNRFGIVGTFNPRQALLAWQLMMGAAFFGIFITINLALLLGVLVVVTAPSDIPRL